jgi:hypothetical protein
MMQLLYGILLMFLFAGCKDKETNAQCTYCCDEFYKKLEVKKSFFLVAVDRSGSVPNSHAAPIHNFVIKNIINSADYGFGSKFFSSVFASDASAVSWNSPHHEISPVIVPEGIQKKLETETTKGCRDAQKYIDAEISKMNAAPMNFLRHTFNQQLPSGLKNSRTKVLSVIKSMMEWSELNAKSSAKLITFFVTDYKFSDFKKVQEFLKGKRFINVTVVQTHPTDNISSGPRSEFLKLLKAHGIEVVTQ